MPHPTSQRSKELFFIIGGLIIIVAVVIAAIYFYLNIVVVPSSGVPEGTLQNVPGTPPEPKTPENKAQLLQSYSANAADASSTDNSLEAHAKVLQSAQTQPSSSTDNQQLSQEDKMKLLQGQQ
jgi:hypothetical protein